MFLRCKQAFFRDQGQEFYFKMTETSKIFDDQHQDFQPQGQHHLSCPRWVSRPRPRDYISAMFMLYMYKNAGISKSIYGTFVTSTYSGLLPQFCHSTSTMADDLQILGDFNLEHLINHGTFCSPLPSTTNMRQSYYRLQVSCTCWKVTTLGNQMMLTVDRRPSLVGLRTVQLLAIQSEWSSDAVGRASPSASSDICWVLLSAHTSWIALGYSYCI